jgi:hypothetical protein
MSAVSILDGVAIGNPFPIEFGENMLGFNEG